MGVWEVICVVVSVCLCVWLFALQMCFWLQIADLSTTLCYAMNFVILFKLFVIILCVCVCASVLLCIYVDVTSRHLAFIAPDAFSIQ